MKNRQKKENLKFIRYKKSIENVYKLSEDEEEYVEFVPLNQGNVDLDELIDEFEINNASEEFNYYDKNKNIHNS